MATLSLAMIVKNEGDTIERVLSAAKLFCDEMIVVDTGSTDDTAAKAKAMGAIVHNFEWIDHFAAARNFSFSHCTKEWIIWLDGDDIIAPENQTRIQELKKTVLNDSLDMIFLRYRYPPFVQWRERLIRRELFGKTIKWQGPIHECLEATSSLTTRYFENIVIQHDTPPMRQNVKKDRNLNILRKHYKKGAYGERMLYIYAIECLNNLLKEEGETIISDFLAIANYSPYKYEIYHKMYDFYQQLGEPEHALNALGKAIVEDPKCAEAYYKLAKHKLAQDDPQAALPLLHTASAMSLPNYGTPETMAYTYGPWELLSHAYFRLGNYARAIDMARKTLTANPPNLDWLNKLANLNLEKFTLEKLPDPWLEWLKGNIAQGVPYWTIVRILTENQFNPAQIMTGFHDLKN